MWMEVPESIIQVSNLGVEAKRMLPTLEDEVWCDV